MEGIFVSNQYKPVPRGKSIARMNSKSLAKSGYGYELIQREDRGFYNFIKLNERL